MSSYTQNSLSILQSASEEALYSKLVAQLRKDFELASVALKVPLDAAPKELITLLREKVYCLILEGFPEYLNLLYIVDVPENIFKDLKITDAVEVADQLSFQILKREFQKVQLKAKYSG